jgi:L-ascorbate metabolism protein UlaG (beta-lactamase superfamily)
MSAENERRESTEGPVFQWLGTAGFRITCGDKVILIDPYLTRNERAFPFQELGPGDMRDADYIFLSHGHFDHIADVPAIMEVAEADVYCSSVSGETLIRMGVPGSRIHTISGGESETLEGFSVSVTECDHIKFDLGLIIKTVPRLLGEFRSLLPRVRGMPAGPVLNTYFDFGDISVLHLGSLGLKPGQVQALGVPSPDILLIPLQGHSDICLLAAKLAAAIRPRAVIPEHHDDFFPPVSQMIDIEPFRLHLKELLPECAYYEPTINNEFDAGDVFGKG